MSERNTIKNLFPTNSPEYKWYAFGRYYAMFPPSFPYYATKGLTDPGDLVLDPFSGRGNSLFCAMTQGRRAVGIDINPLAYLYSAARCSFGVEQDAVLRRLTEVADAVTPTDRRTRNSFQTRAWSPDVRGFLRSARKELDWRGNDVDRILMGFVALHAQDKLSLSGLSNKLPPTIACSPSYAVRWWTERGMTRPPSTNPVESLTDKISRRYQFGTPDLRGGHAYEGDSRKVLAGMEPLEASLLITSPPYIDVSDYWNDHWIRLWLLGNRRFGKEWSRAAKFGGQDNYRELLHGVFSQSKRHLANEATVLVRSDVRRHTSEICKEVLMSVFPDHRMYWRFSEAARVGESVHHGRGGTRAKEVDFLLTSTLKAEEWAREYAFNTYQDTLS